MKWGVNCDKNSNNRNIIENYIQFLACPDVDIIVCSPDNCINETIISTCLLEITAISYERLSNIDGDDIIDIVFFIGTGDYSNATLPFTYSWEFNPDDFIGVEFTTDGGLKLKLKPGKNLDYLNSKITVRVTDASGCTFIKNCYYTPAGMQCADDFVDCVNPGILKVVKLV